jgi:hypothetical protein
VPGGQLSAQIESAVIPLLEPLYRKALRMTSNRVDAEDLIQETVSSRLNCGRKQLRDLLFEHLAFYAGVGAMAVWGSWNCPWSLRWWWVTRFFNAQHNKVLQSLGGASEVA